MSSDVSIIFQSLAFMRRVKKKLVWRKLICKECHGHKTLGTIGLMNYKHAETI